MMIARVCKINVVSSLFVESNYNFVHLSVGYLLVVEQSRIPPCNDGLLNLLFLGAISSLPFVSQALERGDRCAFIVPVSS